MDTKAVGTPLTTVQETSKRLKLHTLGSVFLLIVGLVWLIIAIQAESGSNNVNTTIPAFMVWIGFIWFIVTRFRIWWHHK